MKNRDKYNTYEETMAAFDAFCQLRYGHDCGAQVGHAPPVVRCSMCLQFWLNSDTEAEEKLAQEKAERQERYVRDYVRFEKTYPGLALCDKDLYLLDETSIYKVMFSSRAWNALEKLGIKTIGDYLKLDLGEFAKTRGVGPKLVDECARKKESILRYRKSAEVMGGHGGRTPVHTSVANRLGPASPLAVKSAAHKRGDL